MVVDDQHADDPAPAHEAAGRRGERLGWQRESQFHQDLDLLGPRDHQADVGAPFRPPRNVQAAAQRLQALADVEQAEALGLHQPGLDHLGIEGPAVVFHLDHKKAIVGG